MALYTPFMEKAVRGVGQALNQRAQNKLIGSAYMGEPGAMEQLMQFNPQAAMKLQKSQQEDEQLKLQRASKSEASSREVYAENKEFMDDHMKKVASFDTYQGAAEYHQSQMATMEPILGAEIAGTPITEQVYNQVRTVYGDKPEEASGAFAGTGMPAQVSNALVRGADDPDYRNTAEYYRAWDLANEPNIIRTPTGDMLQQPNIDPRFKPPGVEAQKEPVPVEQIKPSIKPAEEQPGETKPAYLIPGTEKISADQKAYNKDYVLLKKSFDSMQNYIDVLTELGPEMSVGPLNTVTAQKLESAYRRAMLDAKETNGLGVLNGPDLGIMRQFMGDPTGIMGQIKGKTSLLEGASQAMMQITDNFAALNGIMTDTTVKTRDLGGKSKAPKINESDLSVTIEGKKSIFPSIGQYNAYKEAAGL